MAKAQKKYHAYLLRFWPVEEASVLDGIKTVWRVTLEDVQTHTRHGFSNLERAFVFLQQRMHCNKEDCDEME